MPFNLTAGEAATYTLSGSFRVTGDFASIKVNNVSIGYADFATDFGQASHSFSIDSSYFQSGSNTLAIVQYWTTSLDTSFGDGAPAVLLEQDIVPEPATMALAGSALLALGWLRCRRISR